MVSRLKAHVADPQQRNAYFLMMGNLVSAGAGLGFWFLLAAVLGLSAAMIGIGYAVFSVGTLIGVLAKGGLDTALVRSVPESGRQGGLGLLGFAMGVGCAASLVIAVAVAGLSSFTQGLGIGLFGWMLVAVIAVLLVVTWLQDAYFIAEGDARWCFHRNVVLGAGRLLLPVPIVLLALPHPVALSWMLALGLSAMAAVLFTRRLPAREGGTVPNRLFIKRSLRNVTGTAAEFLPGFLLAPLIMIVAGPEPAGHFAIAWSAASLLFLASAAIGRSALSRMVHHPQGVPVVLRKALRQHALILAPAAAAGIVFAPWIMAVFGTEYAIHAASVFVVLCASIVFVGPGYLYLSLLRAKDRTLVLTAFPFVMMVALFVLAPVFAASMGITGVAVAWLVANAPFGLFGAWAVYRHSRPMHGHGSRAGRGDKGDALGSGPGVGVEGSFSLSQEQDP